MSLSPSARSAPALFEALWSVRDVVLAYQRDPRLDGPDPVHPSAARRELEDLAEQLSTRCNEIVAELQIAECSDADERDCLLRARLLNVVDCGARMQSFAPLVAKFEAEAAA